jgi:hypothetical protein
VEVLYMRNKVSKSKVISLRGRKYMKKYKALYAIITKVKLFFCKKKAKPSVGISFRKTINN